MSTKDYRGKEIIISITDPEPEPAEKKKRRGFIPPTKRPGDPLKRRTRDDEPVDYGLDVYDLGLTTGGADIDFRKDATLTVNPSTLGLPYELTGRNITTEFNAAILPELAAGTGAGRRITNLTSPKYGSAVGNVCAGTWDNDRGFVAGNAGHIVINNGNPFYKFNTIPGADAGIESETHSGYTKITDVLDYNAPSAEFYRDRDAELFLAPRAFFSFGESRVGFQFSGGGTTYDRFAANYFAEALPRSYFLDNADWETFRGAPMFATGYNMFYRGDTSPATAAFTGNQTIVDSWRAMIQTRPGARLWKWTRNKATNALISEGAVSPASFPTYYPGPTPVPPFSTQPFYNNVRLPAYFYSDIQSHIDISPGHFLGALRLKPTDDLPEQWFYFWRRSSTVLWALSTVAQGTIGGSSFGARWEVRV